LRIICVGDDVVLAEALAEAFSAAGFSIDEQGSDATLAHVSAGLLLWSKAAIRTPAFRSAAQAAIDSGKAVIAHVTGAALPPIVRASPVFDLSRWNGDPEAPVLDQIAQAVEQLVSAKPAPAPPEQAPPPAPEQTPAAQTSAARKPAAQAP